MTRTLRPPTRRFDRCRPRLERLESRLALDASSPGVTLVSTFATAADVATAAPLAEYLSVVSTNPGGGASISTPTNAVSVTFDRPVDPSTLGTNDIVVQGLQGGNWVDLFDAYNPPTETLDATGTVLTLALPSPLTPGTYRLDLPEFSFLGGLDGSSVADMGADQIIGTFTVVKPGVTLADAQNLGTPGPTPLQVAGTLDLADDPSAVQLEKFTVAPGHHWRLAAEVDSATLASALALFNSQGTLIASADAGLPDSKGDAFLYAGLGPGTYYLGVSGQGNLPNLPGGYNPVTGTPGSAFNGTPGGAFTLSLAVDQADAPVRLLGATLTYADPASANPTGMTFAFSGLLDLDTLQGDPTPGFYLAGPNGQDYSMTAVGFTESSATYTFQFDEPLPVGHYTVYAAPQSHGGATDLAGFSPVGPGQPAGVVWGFNVQQAWEPTGPNDLGSLWGEAQAGVSRSVGLLPGAEVTYRFVVENSAPFKFQESDATGKVRLEVLDATSQAVIGSAVGAVANLPLTLAPGVYFLRFVNAGKSSTALTWNLKQSVSADSLLDNGIGQSPAMSFRLVDPTTAGDPSSSDPSGPGPAAGAAATPVSLAYGPTSTPGVSAASSPASDHGGVAGFGSPSVGPSGLLLTLGNTLVGRPTADTARAADAGLDGAVAAASAGPGYGQGLLASSTPGGVSSDDEAVAAAGGPVVGADLEPVNGALAGELRAEAPRPDELVLAAADWIAGAGEAASRWLALRPAERPADGPIEKASATPIVLVRDDSPPAPETDRVQQAQLGPPLAVGVMTVLSLRYHPPFRRWLRRGKAVGERPGASAVRGPHRRN